MTTSNPSTPSKASSKATFGSSYLKKKRENARGTPGKERVTTGDRFIPSRAVNCPVDEHYRSRTLFDTMNQESSFDTTLHNTMFGQEAARVLSFGPPAPTHGNVESPNHLSLTTTPTRDTCKTKRKRLQDPTRYYDVPELIDDFYLNLVAWSSDNILAVGLKDRVFLRDQATGHVRELCQVADTEYICSVEWIGKHYLAVGVSYGRIECFDVVTGQHLRRLRGHHFRVGAIAVLPETLSLVSGGQDGCLVHHDVRIKRHIISKTTAGHAGEICQLKWSPDKKMLASGGNDDTVRIWDRASLVKERLSFQEHKAAVKAIAWSPITSAMIATGGGNTDKTIKIWNARNGLVKKSVDTAAQVTSIAWSPTEPDLLLSAHGFRSPGLCLWRFPSVKKVQTFELHADVRPLSLVLCPENSTVCVACSDETLRIWDDLFVAPLQPSKSVLDGTLLTDHLSCLQIR